MCRAAIKYIFFCTCQSLGNDAVKWLTHVPNHIGSAKPEDLHRLLPSKLTELLHEHYSYIIC